jgi:membrane protein implicated in regulation of membrane protease activity
MTVDAESRARRQVGFNMTKLKDVRKVRVGQSWFNTVGLMFWQVKYAALIMGVGGLIFWVTGFGPWYVGIVLASPPALAIAYSLLSVETRGKSHDRFFRDQASRLVQRRRIVNGKRAFGAEIVVTDARVHVRGFASNDHCANGDN